MRGITPDDPWITEMDPVQKMWMFESWLADREEEAELAKNIAYLVASFDHPEAVKQLLGEGNVHESSDEEFEASWEIVKESQKQTEGKKRKKKRRLIEG